MKKKRRNHLKIRISDIKSKDGLFFVFLKIFIIFFLSMLPIVMHNLINVKHSYYLPSSQTSSPDQYIIGAQAIGYAQPMVFFAVNCLVLIIVNIITSLKQSFNRSNIKQQPKDIINSGIVYVLTTSIIVSILVMMVMWIYSATVLENFNYPIKNHLQLYLNQYVLMIFIYILILGITIFYEFVIIECGINYWLILSITIISAGIDIGMSILLNFYTNMGPVISCVTGTIIPTFLRLLIFAIIFYTKIANWRVWETKVLWKYFKSFWTTTWILSTYMFTYGVMMVIQMTFMSLIVSNPSGQYLVTENGQYTIIITRIIVYNILNLVIVIPKSMSRAVVSKYNNKSDTYWKIKNYYKSMKICNYSLVVMLVIGLIIFIFSGKIIDNLYEGVEWTNEPVREPYPINYFGKNARYIDIIKSFFWRGLLFGIFAQLINNFSICYRVITYYYLERNTKSFIIMLIFFAIIYSLGNYFFGVYLQSIFKGLIGFMLTISIYGVISTIIIAFVSYNMKFKLMNEWISNHYDDCLEQSKKINVLYTLKKMRYYKELLLSIDKRVII